MDGWGLEGGCRQGNLNAMVQGENGQRWVEGALGLPYSDVLEGQSSG